MAIETEEESNASTEGSVPVLNYRPGPEFGHQAGKGARQLARMNHLISMGALADGLAEGKITGYFYNPNTHKYEERTVNACVPIPKSEMVPDSPKPLVGVVTPYVPSNRADFIRKQTNNRRQGED